MAQVTTMGKTQDLAVLARDLRRAYLVVNAALPLEGDDTPLPGLEELPRPASLGPPRPVAHWRRDHLLTLRVEALRLVFTELTAYDYDVGGDDYDALLAGRLPAGG